MRIFFANKFKVFNQYSWDKRYLSHEQIVERRRELINDVVLPTLGKVLANTYKHIIVNIVIAAFFRLYWPTCRSWPIYISLAVFTYNLYQEIYITTLINLEPLEEIKPEQNQKEGAPNANANIANPGVNPAQQANNRRRPGAAQPPQQNEKFNRYNARNQKLATCAHASLFVALLYLHWIVGKTGGWIVVRWICSYVDESPELAKLYVRCKG